MPVRRLADTLFRYAACLGRLLVYAVSISASTIASPAIADQWSQAVGYRCLKDPEHFIIYPVPYDANGPIPETRDGLFVQMWSGDDPHKISTVAECRIAGKNYRLRRVYQNKPRPSGGHCAGANWARYRLLQNDQLVAQFDIGCSISPILSVTPNNVSLCSRRGCDIAYLSRDFPLGQP